MIQGIYLAAMGMTPLMDKQDQIANNLANVKTTGFKQSGAFIKTFQKYLSNDKQEPFVNIEMKTDEIYIDYSPGSMIKTDAPLDLYIQGNGFFTVMTPDGIKYTRNGNMTIDKDGYLTTAEGYKVLGKEGFIKINLKENYPVVVSETGEIFQNNMSIGSLKITDFEKPYNLKREGNCLFMPKSPEVKQGDSVSFVVKQGYLESSNVNIIKNMVEMISAYRNFEANQKALAAQDDTLDKAVNQLGRIQ
jgi:flagellar basal-body rod protein FlgG